MSSISSAASDLARHGAAYAPQIAEAAARHGVDPRLLAAVAAQETGGPGSNAGANVVGDGGHGHGLFQIDDRWHPFASTSAAMEPAANADYAAGMLRGLLDRYGGDVHEALSAYNAGSPNARGTATTWRDGATLGYADSVLRHYQQLGGPTTVAADSTSLARRSPMSFLAAALPLVGSLIGNSMENGAMGAINAADEAFQVGMYAQQTQHQERMAMQSSQFDQAMDERSENMREINTLRDISMQQRKANDQIEKKFIESITQ